MKKIALITLISFFSITYSYAWVKTTTTKTNGGLFGYSSIQEQLSGPPTSTNCTFTLKCWDPGWTKCKFIYYDIASTSQYGCQSIVINNQGDDDWWDVLNDDINNQITNGHSSGTFVRQDIQITHPTTNNLENAVVTWSYSSSNDILEMTVYSYGEAQGLGVI